MDPATETIAKFLESFAYQVEDESRSLPMLPKTADSWTGFTHDAQVLQALLKGQR